MESGWEVEGEWRDQSGEIRDCELRSWTDGIQPDQPKKAKKAKRAKRATHSHLANPGQEANARSRR